MTSCLCNHCTMGSFDEGNFDAMNQSEFTPNHSIETVFNNHTVLNNSSKFILSKLLICFSLFGSSLPNK